jgi:hypothetical protein
MTKSYELDLNQNSCADLAPGLTISFSKVIALIVSISFGGGLWVNIQHELEGAHEAKEIPPVLHWLRDSTLAMIFIFFGVLMALAFSRWLIQRANGKLSRPSQLVLITVCLGVFSGAAFAVGVPVHAYIFGTRLEGGAELIADMLKDGSLAALVNMGIAALMIFVVNGLE